MKHATESPPIPLRGAPLWPLSVAAYRVLGEAGLIPKNTELLYGLVYTKMSKSPFHSFLVLRLLRLLEPVMPQTHHVRSEQPLACLESEPEPDVSVVRGKDSDFLVDHPSTADLVVEVCVTSHEYDRSKLHAYATVGVKECWFVLGPEKQIEVHRIPKDGHFTERTLHGPGGNVSCGALPEVTISLDALFPQAS